MMYEGVWVVITALSRDHGIQLVHHGQQQLELVGRLLQMHKHEVAQNSIPNLHRTKKPQLATEEFSQDFCVGQPCRQSQLRQAICAADGVVMLKRLPYIATETEEKGTAHNSEVWGLTA